MTEVNTNLFFEKIYNGKVSKTDQLLFIKNVTGHEIDRLKYLLYDLDEYIDRLHADNYEIPDLDIMHPYIMKYEDQDKIIPLITMPNPVFREALYKDEDLSEIPEYIEENLNITKLLELKEFYSLQVFRIYISQKVNSFDENHIEKEQKESISSLDLSNTKATEKLIYLKELGIIEHLRKIEPFKHSVNKLATVLSAITDEKASTLQPKLNAMLTGYTNAHKNDPYYYRAKVIQIKQSLIQIGFNIDD